MNVYTLLGAALCDEGIRELLFVNPVKAAQELGLFLTSQELIALKAFLTNDDVEEHFEYVQQKNCPNPPCPLNLARLGDCDEKADDRQKKLTSAAD
jgi:hypothetical protein